MNERYNNVPERTTVRRVDVLSALGALLAALAFPLLAADPPKCQLVRIFEWPVQLKGGLPVIEGSINGKKIGVLLDTGAYASLIPNAAPARLALSTCGSPHFMPASSGQSPL